MEHQQQCDVIIVTTRDYIDTVLLLEPAVAVLRVPRAGDALHAVPQLRHEHGLPTVAGPGPPPQHGREQGAGEAGRGVGAGGPEDGAGHPQGQAGHAE